MPNEGRRVCVISFDFKQHKGTNQSRKTRFFRELYGYTQQVKQRLKDGETVVRTYHYPGVLDQLPYTKLGKSVIAVQPGTEDKIIELLRGFEEVVFYNFIGWLPTSFWPMKNGDEENTIGTLIAVYGYLSLLVQMHDCGEDNVKLSMLLDAGFDMNYLKRAVQHLSNRKLIIEEQDAVKLTSKGRQLASQVA